MMCFRSLNCGQSCIPYSAIFIWTLSNMGSKMLVRLDGFTTDRRPLVTHTSALRFFSTFSPCLPPSRYAELHHLSTILLPTHVQSDNLAQRFRNDKYVVRMSRSGFSLLLGWLTEGFGGEAFGSGGGFKGDKGKRGRAAIMRVVNNHLRFDGQPSVRSF